MARKGERGEGRGRRGLWIVGIAAAVVVSALAGTLAARRHAAPSPSDARVASVDFPPPAPTAPATVRPEDFVGAEACADCHRTQYEAWAGSTHGRAGGQPGPDVVIAPFDGRPIRFVDATVIPRIRAGTYEFVVRQKGFDDEVYRVDGVIGGGHMLGGGTQGFLTRWRDGTERFLPWDWSRAESRWFCNTGSRLDRGWVPVTRDMRLADCGDWPPIRPIGTTARFANCQECHGSQIRISFDADAGAYATEYTSLRVNCESCHGPARRHVEMARDGIVGPEDPGLNTLASLDKDASLEVCFRCHALKDVVTEGYLPGETLEAYYALKFPVLGDQPYLADGRVRTFAYQANHLASACYLEGPMDCVSCHEPHGQGYWDVNRQPLASPFDDGQCTSCHPSKGIETEAHTFHPASSDGSRCVSCHMPYLQHPEVGPEVRFSRSDHTIAVPRPAFDADLGIVGACAGCHADRTARDLDARAREWWGELRPHRPLVQGIIGELRARNREEAADLLLRPDQKDPLIQFQALSRLLVGYLGPDLQDLSPEVVERLRALTRSPDLDVRALALATLHWTRGDDPEVRTELAAALRNAASGQDAGRSAASGDAPLRRRWALALGFLGDYYRERENFDRSLSAYRKAREILPDDPRILDAQGLLYTRTGDFAAAVRAFRRSLELDPGVPLTRVNLGIALAGMGDTRGATEVYQDAIRRNPHESLAHFNLGNVYQREGRLDAAAAAYRRAVEEDPGMGRGHFELARTLILMGRRDEALPHARRAVEFLREHPASRQMLRDLEGG